MFHENFIFITADRKCEYFQFLFILFFKNNIPQAAHLVLQGGKNKRAEIIGDNFPPEWCPLSFRFTFKTKIIKNTNT